MTSPLVFPPPVDPNNQGRGPMIMGISWTFTGLAIVFVALRVYLRKTVKKLFGLDDWFMVFAVLFQVASMCFVTIAIRRGLGMHDQDLQKPDQYVDVLKWAWISSEPSIMVSVLARISIAILLIRLFGIRLWFKWVFIILTTLQTVLAVLALILILLVNKPLTGLWDVFNPSVTRFSSHVVQDIEYASQSLSTLSDLLYVLWPGAIIWDLNLPLRNRIGLMVLMSVSLFTMSMSLMKIIVTEGSANAGPNASYNSSMGIFWSNLEQTCVIIMGCVPALRSITKIKLPMVTVFGSSVSSLFKKIKTRKLSAGNNDYRGMDENPYQDLEMNSTHKLGRSGASRKAHGFTVNSSYFPEGRKESNQSLVAENHVRRTDEFTVSFGPRKTSAPNIGEEIVYGDESRCTEESELPARTRGTLAFI